LTPLNIRASAAPEQLRTLAESSPLFQREEKESRAHGNDERISVASLSAGTTLLMEIVLAAAR